MSVEEQHVGNTWATQRYARFVPGRQGSITSLTGLPHWINTTGRGITGATYLIRRSLRYSAPRSVVHPKGRREPFARPIPLHCLNRRGHDWVHCCRRHSIVPGGIPPWNTVIPAR